MHWGIDRWKREIEDLKVMGAETIWYLPLQFGQRKPEDLKPDSKHMQLQVAIGHAIHDAGLSVGIYQGLNDVFAETLIAHPDWKAEEGKYFLEEGHATPSILEAWEEIMRLRRKLYAQLPYVDYMITPATDYGGDGSESCAPWPLTYLKRFEMQVDLMKEFHPDVKIIGAGHGLPIDELDMLREALPSCNWLDYVADIPRGAGKPVIKYYMYPEITMLGSWGTLGACPCPQAIQTLYQSESDAVEGIVAYSEGIHDDVNKYTVLRLAADQSLSADSIVRDYCREWLFLDEDEAATFGEIILGLGNSAIQGRIYVDSSDGFHYPQHDQWILWMDQLRRTKPALQQNFRFWLLFYRTICEAMCQTEGTIPAGELTALAEESRDAFLNLEPAYGKFIQEKHPSLRPGVAPWVWPRTAHASWRRERSFG
jgi:hypothetical protein